VTRASQDLDTEGHTAARHEATGNWFRWRVFAYAAAATAACSVGYFIVRSPLQIGDCLDNMLDLQRDTLAALFTNQFHQRGYMRPMLWAALKVAFEASNGHYFWMYKTIHVLQVLALVVLFVRLLRVDTMARALAVPFGVVVLFGNHTFAPIVIEAFPINHFLTVMLCCLAAANLAFARPALWRDIAAVLLFAIAVLTVETGLLVWVIVAAAWLGGCRGVSRRTILLMSAALLAYFVLRFGLLPAGAPQLVERSSGFGFRILEPDEMAARFGHRPLVFYAYNVISHVLSVLFAEPKAGVWYLTRGLVSGDVSPAAVIGVLGSTGSTVLIAGYALARARDWRHGLANDHDRLVLLFVAVLAGNAVIGFPYTKNHIIAPAGVFHALAATAAMAYALGYLARSSFARPAAVVLMLALISLNCVSVVRYAGLHYRIREAAWKNQNDWAHQGPTTTRWNVPEDPMGQRMIRQLYDESVAMRVPGTFFLNSRLLDRFFEEF